MRCVGQGQVRQHIVGRRGAAGAPVGQPHHVASGRQFGRQPRPLRRCVGQRLGAHARRARDATNTPVPRGAWSSCRCVQHQGDQRNRRCPAGVEATDGAPGSTAVSSRAAAGPGTASTSRDVDESVDEPTVVAGLDPVTGCVDPDHSAGTLDGRTQGQDQLVHPPTQAGDGGTAGPGGTAQLDGRGRQRAGPTQSFRQGRCDRGDLEVRQGRRHAPPRPPAPPTDAAPACPAGAVPAHRTSLAPAAPSYPAARGPARRGLHRPGRAPAAPALTRGGSARPASRPAAVAPCRPRAGPRRRTRRAPPPVRPGPGPRSARSLPAGPRHRTRPRRPGRCRPPGAGQRCRPGSTTPPAPRAAARAGSARRRPQVRRSRRRRRRRRLHGGRPALLTAGRG